MSHGNSDSFSNLKRCARYRPYRPAGSFKRPIRPSAGPSKSMHGQCNDRGIAASMSLGVFRGPNRACSESPAHRLPGRGACTVAGTQYRAAAVRTVTRSLGPPIPGYVFAFRQCTLRHSSRFVYSESVYSSALLCTLRHSSRFGTVTAFTIRRVCPV